MNEYQDTNLNVLSPGMVMTRVQSGRQSSGRDESDCSGQPPAVNATRAVWSVL